MPDDRIDPYEPRLARRIDAFAEQAVRPIDPLAIAAAAHAGARRQTAAGRLFGSAGSMARFGLVLAGALVAAAAFGMYIGAGGRALPAATNAAPVAAPTAVPLATPTAVPLATPTAVPGGPPACAANALSGSISGWDGAAGHRIATVNVTNGARFDCTIPTLVRPALVDADGHALMVGAPVTGTSTLRLTAITGSATTFIDMSNFCGAAPTSALRIRLYLPSEESVEATAVGGLDPLDVPPCNGPNAPATIEMQAFTRTGP